MGGCCQGQDGNSQSHSESEYQKIGYEEMNMNSKLLSSSVPLPIQPPSYQSIDDINNNNYNNSSVESNLIVNNKMNVDEWTKLCFDLIEIEFWDDAKKIIDHHPINTDMRLNRIDLVTRIIAKSRPYPKDSIQKSLCYSVIQKCSVEMLNSTFNETFNNLLLREMIVLFKHPENLDLELFHQLIIHGTNLRHRNSDNIDALGLALKMKNRQLYKLFIYHLNFVGTKEQQKVFPADFDNLPL